MNSGGRVWWGLHVPGKAKRPSRVGPVHPGTVGGAAAVVVVSARP